MLSYVICWSYVIYIYIYVRNYLLYMVRFKKDMLYRI